jgi:hypothetical protein
VESFNSQEGNAGPTTNLLSMLGGSLPAGATQRSRCGGREQALEYAAVL